MKWLKVYEDFKVNNKGSGLITKDDIIECIKSGGVIFSNTVMNYPDNDPESAIVPLSIDEDGLISVDIDGDIYSVDIKNVEKVEF
jgi:hypothetical protein